MQGASLYVTLEPAVISGKLRHVPIQSLLQGLKRVIFSVKDPNPLVCGVRQLKQSGIEITEGMHEQATELTKIFLVCK